MELAKASGPVRGACNDPETQESSMCREDKRRRRKVVPSHGSLQMHANMTRLVRRGRKRSGERFIGRNERKPVRTEDVVAGGTEKKGRVMSCRQLRRAWQTRPTFSRSLMSSVLLSPTVISFRIDCIRFIHPECRGRHPRSDNVLFNLRNGVWKTNHAYCSIQLARCGSPRPFLPRLPTLARNRLSQTCGTLSASLSHFKIRAQQSFDVLHYQQSRVR